MANTYIKIDRNLLRWQWFTEPITLQVFLWLILKANITDNCFQGTLVKRGQIATSYATIMRDCPNISRQSLITALNRLQSSGEIEKTLCRNFQIITVVNYDKYQNGNKRQINEL